MQNSAHFDKNGVSNLVPIYGKKGKFSAHCRREKGKKYECVWKRYIFIFDFLIFDIYIQYYISRSSDNFVIILSHSELNSYLQGISYGRQLFRGCLVERRHFRSSNGSFKYNQDLDRRTLIDNSTSSTEEVTSWVNINNK